jgi:hypothetical protein
MAQQRGSWDMDARIKSAHDGCGSGEEWIGSISALLSAPVMLSS